MRRLTVILFAFLMMRPAVAADTPPVAIGKIAAHPALWTVHGSKGTAYLLGSLHVLPPNMEWRTPEISSAMAASDVFVFEIPMDESTKSHIADFVRDNAFLPHSLALPSLLTADAREDYGAALELTHFPPGKLVNMRPWAAILMLEVAYMAQRHLSPDAGVDRQVYADAIAAGGKTFRALETPEQQFRLLMPSDQKLEVAEFDEGLKELLHDQGMFGNLIDAWAHGDVARMERLINADMKSDPRVEKTLLIDRNRKWVDRIVKMLDEPHSFFITVGAGHLSGREGVPQLLRRKGFKVDGP